MSSQERSKRVEMIPLPPKLLWRDFAWSIFMVLTSVPVIYLIFRLNEKFSSQPEIAVKIIGIVFVILFLLAIAVYLIAQRKSVNVWKLGAIIVTAISVSLFSIYIYWVSFYVFFPADILTWSEGDFVNDILKFCLNYPLYSPQVNNDSFTYSPGSRLLTYFLAGMLGNGTSIPLFRVIQVFYTFLAAIISMLCCSKLVDFTLPKRQVDKSKIWVFVGFPLFFLMATNSLTNPFVHLLHDDALAQLITAGAFWLLLEYTSSRRKVVLLLMAILPGVGFLVKQSLAVWALFYLFYLAFFDQPRSTHRIGIFTLLSFGGIGLVLGLCYLLWGNDFFYWTIHVLGKHGVSPLRSFQHVLDAWPYFVIGIWGGIILVRGKTFRVLLGPWLIWFLLIFIEAYTSGIAWLRNHMGPGSLIAGVWFVAGMLKLSPGISRSGKELRLAVFTRVFAYVAAVGLLFHGMGIVRVPLQPISKDLYRYIKDIEKEFEGQSANHILVDIGSWVYIKDGIIMKDRAPSIGERGYSETGDFSGILERLKTKRYSKILVRHLHEKDFWYDHFLWPKSSGIRRTLLDHYQVVGKIKGVQSGQQHQHLDYFFDEISILLPRTKSIDGSR